MKNATIQLVLLDDDAWLRRNWELRSDAAGITLASYANPDIFLNEIESISKVTPIFVDYDLGHKIHGLEVLRKLSRKGYKNLHLASGMCSFEGTIENFPFKITSKEFPNYLFAKKGETA